MSRARIVRKPLALAIYS